MINRSDGNWDEVEWQVARHLCEVLWPNIAFLCPWGEDSKEDAEQENGASRDKLPTHSSKLAVDKKLPTEPSEEQITSIKSWLSRCDTSAPSHESCSIGAHKNWRGMRFIDVTRKCVVLAPPDADYAVLSYVWGGFPQTLLLQANMADLMTPGGLEHPDRYIPRTIREAMMLCERLGETYLWVDALCIQQDDVCLNPQAEDSSTSFAGLTCE